MSVSTYSGSEASLDKQLSSVISAEALNSLLARLPAKASYDVVLSNGADSVSGAGADLLLVNDTPSEVAAIEALTANAQGGYDDAGSLATYVTSASLDYATNAAFIELQGAGTVAGGDAPVYLVDASHDTSSVQLEASSGKSFLIGGSGHDTLIGSTSTTGVAVMVAGSGPTTMTGGEGHDSMYGGGLTTITGGSGSDQSLLEYTANSHDSLTAGTGGKDVMAVVSGNNVLNDASGVNDSLYAGSGMDTLFGSTNGSSINLYQGNSSVDSAASDTINIATATASHSDTITASLSGLDTVTFGGYSSAYITSHEVTDPTDPSTVTINFGTTAGGVTQTATLHNISHITFGNG